jgi:protein-S-isoprenylcysteine O-methyltransferase Ste14
VITWAMLVNTHFETIVRIQTDRHHQVTTSGPYAVVRHPGYVGACLWALAAPLIVGSLVALIPAALATGVLVVRTSLEDRTLQRELPGYADYTQRTPYRLLPGLW